MRVDCLIKLNAARAARKGAVAVTLLASGQSRVVLEDEIAGDRYAEALSGVMRSGKPASLETDEGAVFLNPYLPPPRIVVIGAVHISQALAQMAPVCGYDLMIIDPRTAFATEERFSGVRLAADWPQDVLASEPLDRYTALAAVTHDPKIDDFPLAEALKAGCFYVGALGSRKTHAKRVERLTEMGCPPEDIARIAAPIGLDIGAASPAEIALATMAQIVEAFRKRPVTDARMSP